MPPKEDVKAKEDNRQAIVGLKSICTNLEALGKQLDEKVKLEADHHKQTCTNITNIQTKIDTALKQLGDIEKKLY